MFRHSIILRDVGAVLKFVSFVFIVPIMVAIIYNETLMVCVFFVLAGLIYLIAAGLHKLFNSETDAQIAENMVTVAIVWLLAVAFSALPFLFYNVSYLDAFFEAMSAWTTTGLSLVDVEAMPMSLLFLRSFCQWVGGLGIVVLALVGLFRSSRSLYFAESREEQIQPNIYNTVIIIWLIYSFYTVLGVAALAAVGMNLFDAINHSFTAISTGGMSTHVEGVVYFNSTAIEIVLMCLMILGAITFLTHFKLFKGKKIFVDVQVKLLLGLIIFALFGFLFFTPYSLRQSVFQIVSALTSTGFNTVDLANWSELGKFALIILMVIGGSAGSTSGGLKLVRVALAFKMFVWRIKKIVRPHLLISKKVGENVFNNNDAAVALRFVVLFILLLVVAAFVLILTGYSLTDAFFMAATSLGSAGIATVPITTALQKIVIIFSMWIGRLEIWPVLILFYGLFIFKKK